MLVRQSPIPQGSPLCTIPLGNGKYAIVDPEDFENLSKYTWFYKVNYSSGYAARKVRHKASETLIFMHRQITHCPKNKIVHHVNHNTLDNRKVNLLNMTREQHDYLHSTCGF